MADRVWEHEAGRSACVSDDVILIIDVSNDHMIWSTFDGPGKTLICYSSPGPYKQMNSLI